MNAILEQINSTGKIFVEFALPMLVQSSVLILILLLTDFALRKKVRAVFRYWIWMLVLIKLLLPTSLSSPLSLGYFFGEGLAYVDISQTTTEAETMETTQANVSPIIETPRIEASRHTSAVAPIIPDTEPAVTEPINSPVVSVTPITWQGAVFLAWLTVVIAMGLLLLQRAIFVRGLVAQAKDANDLMADTLESCRRSMGVKRKIGLKVSANATSPAVCGLFRPVILVPKNLTSNLSASQLQAVLLHELAHIKRGDLWVNLAQTFLQIIYFYNPLLWLANCIIRRTREQAVDEMVLVAMGAKARQYPQALVNVAKLAFKRPVLSLRLIGVVESKSALAGRIKHILNRPMPKRAKLGILGLAVVIIAAAILLPMAACTPGPPSLVIKGTVKDAQTGKPIAGARVFDDGYGPKPNWEQIKADVRSEWGAITNSAGEYSFLTWPEHHSIKVEAPGYKAKRESLYDGHFVFNTKDEEIFDFALEPEKILESSGFKKTLPNGVTVELVGICETPTTKGQQWWRADGMEMKEPEYELRGKQAFKYPAFGYLLKFSPWEDLNYRSQINLEYLFMSSGPITNKGQAIVFWGENGQLTEPLPNQADVKVDVAAGEWTENEPGQYSVYPEFTNLPNKKIIILSGLRPNPKEEMVDKTLIEATTTSSDVDIELECITKDGKTLKSWHEGTLISEGQLIQHTFGFTVPLQNIDKILVKHRRFYQVKFKNISIKPEHKTNVQVEVEGAKWTRVTTSGGKVSVVGSVDGPAVVVRKVPHPEGTQYFKKFDLQYLLEIVSKSFGQDIAEAVGRKSSGGGSGPGYIHKRIGFGIPFSVKGVDGFRKMRQFRKGLRETIKEDIKEMLSVIAGGGGTSDFQHLTYRADRTIGTINIFFSENDDDILQIKFVIQEVVTSKDKTDVQIETEKPQSLIFHGLDLAAVPHTTNSSKLPDLFEERPLGSKSYHIQKDVTAIYSGLDRTVYFIPRRNIFYVQHDKLGSSTLTYYGPFEGNPVQVLNLQPDLQVEVDPVVVEWEDIGKAVPADFNDTVSLVEHITLGSIGQNAEGKTFISLLRDREKTRDHQYRFILIRRNGTVLEPASYNPLLFGDKLWERFSFDIPYHRNQIKEFRLQRFPQNLERKASLPMVKPYDPDVNGKIAAQATSGPPGRGALHFDGQNDYLYVPDSRSLSMRAPFTVEMWIKPEFPKEQFEDRTSWDLIGKGCIGKDWIFGRGKVEMRGFGITLHRFGDDPNLLMVDYCAANAGGVYTKSYGRRDFDDWMHLYHVFRPDRYQPGYDHPLVIGRFLTTEHPFAGQIGEVRIWAGVRSRNQISQYRNKPLTGDEPDLAACWTFEQSGGQIAYDITTHRNHARLGTTTDADAADPTWVTVTGGSTIDKEPGNETDDQVLARSTLEPVGRHALSFDGIDDYLHVDANPTLKLQPPFTIEMWLKPDFSAIQQADSSKKQWRQLALMRKGKKLFQEKKIQTGGFLMFAGLPTRPDWKCYGSLYLANEKGQAYEVSGFVGERLQPERPGWLYASVSCTRETYIPVLDQPLLIGENLVSDWFPFKGDIAEIRIWAGVSSRYQIAQYRNKPLNGNEPGLVACWDFKRPGGQVVYDIGPNGNHARLGGSEGPDDADPKWVDLKATSHLPSQKTNMQVKDTKIAPGSSGEAVDSSELTGRVVDENGNTVADAQVALSTEKIGVLVSNGKLQPIRSGVESRIVQTDSQGMFDFGQMPVDNFDLIVAHEKGFAMVESEEFVASGEIHLQPWCCIEGQLAEGRKAAGNKIWMSLLPNSTWFRHKREYSDEIKCDESGHFVFDKVPSGWFEVGYLTRTGKNSWSLTSRTPVAVKPGQTAKMRLGGEGRPVTGRFVPPEGYDKSIYFGEGLRSLLTVRPQEPRPDNYDRMTKQQQRQWREQWHKTDEYKKYRDDYWHHPDWRQYTFFIEKDGSFRIDDVIAGKYQLTVWIEERHTGQGRPEEIAGYYGTIEVPEIPGGRSDEPLDLGELELTMHNPLRIGDIAPLFEAKTLDGKDLKLIDYRGKFVLLSFWQPVFHPEKQQLQELYDTYGGNRQLEIIGLGGNDTLEEVKNYVRENAIPWPQIYTGEEFKSGIAKDYGGFGIFLIDPDGRIVAKDLRGEKLMSTVNEILNAASQNKTDQKTDAQVSKPVKQPVTQAVDKWIPLKVDYPEPPSDSYDPYYSNRTMIQGKKLAEKPAIVLVPPDVTNVAKGKPVTSTDAMMILGELEYITDGDKRPKYYVEYEPKELPQHVTIDLEKEYEIYAVAWWHCYDRAAVYWDVVVQVGRDPKFEDAVILFNNDHDGSLGLGKGTDLNYIETNKGWMAGANGVVGRYVRLYNHTNSRNLINQYTEVEVYGRLKASRLNNIDFELSREVPENSPYEREMARKADAQVEGEAEGQKPDEQREKISRLISAELPFSVSNAKYHRVSFGTTGKIYAKFDIPVSDLKVLLSQSYMLPDFPELSKDEKVRKRMQHYQPRVDWWKPDELKDPLYGHWSRGYYAPEGTNVWIHSELQICCSEIDKEQMRIYIGSFSDGDIIYGLASKQQIIKDKLEQVLYDPNVIKQVAGQFFNRIRIADYDYFLNSKHPDVWKEFPIVGYYNALQGYRYPDLVTWICKTFKHNPIISVRLRNPIVSENKWPVVPYTITLKDGKILKGDLRFTYHSFGPEEIYGKEVVDKWLGVHGIDWNLIPESELYNPN